MSIGVGLGLAEFTFDSSAGYWQWVRMCDEGGVDSLWQTDRLVSRTPFLECMSAMAGLAGATKHIKFGMNVASLGIRDPLETAKQCATIDYLSDGRLLPAFGLGSNRSRDWIASGRQTKARGQRMNEALEIMTRLWIEETVTFEGKHFQYDEASIMPRPVQSPLPLWIGGGSEAAIERSGRFGTGWQGSFETPEKAGEVAAAILESAQRHDRPMDPDHMGIGFGVRFGDWDEPVVQRAEKAYKASSGGKDPRLRLAVGGAEEIMDKIEAYADNGISKFILRPIGAGDSEMMAQTERILAEVMPAVAAFDASRKAKTKAA